MKRMIRMRKLFLLVAAASTAITTGTLLGGYFAGTGQASRSAPPDVGAMLAQEGTGTKVADYGGAAAGRAVFVKQLSNGDLCISDARADGSAPVGGCNPASDALGGRSMTVTIAYDGGPTLSTISNARVFGLVAPAVHGLELRMSDGSSQVLTLQKTGLGGGLKAFAGTIPESALSSGVTPVALVAFGAGGTIIDTEPATIGG